MFSCEFYEFFKDTFFTEHLRWLLLEMGENTWKYMISTFLLVPIITNTMSLKLSIKLQIKIIHVALLCEKFIGEISIDKKALFQWLSVMFYVISQERWSFETFTSEA